MNRLLLAVLAVLLLTPIAAAVDFGLGTALFTSTPPTLDGTLDPAEWRNPAMETMSSVSDPTPITVEGTFSGASDCTIDVTVLFSTDQLYLAIEITDDVVEEDDVLVVEVGGQVFTIEAGEATDGPTGSWQVVKNPSDPWIIEMRVAASLLGSTDLGGAVLPWNVRFEDDDDGPDGVMERNQAGAGILLCVAPRTDLLDVAAMLDALAPTFSDVGNLAKRADRLRKAADAEHWTDDFTYASKKDAAKSLHRVRKVIKKLEKYQAKDPSLAASLDEPLRRLMQAMRTASARLVLLAWNTPGADTDAADEKLAAAETAAAADDRRGAAKQYRKAAKKAAAEVY